MTPTKTQLTCTEGDWIHQRRGEHRFLPAHRIKAGTNMIVWREFNYPEGEADFNLMATAKELYLCLAEMIDFGGSHDEMLELDKRARAALAAARGETP